MSAKVILVLCAQALFIQTAFCSCLGRRSLVTPNLIAPGCAGNGWAANGLIGNGLIRNGCAGNWANNGFIGHGIFGNGLISNGLTGLGIIPTSGGRLLVSSTSAFAPSGLSVTSENVYEGTLYVNGELPFLSAVALEDVLPCDGAGAISYSCGNGITAIESIAPSAAAYGAAGAYGLGAGYGPGAAAIAPAALGLGYGGRGCRCGVY